jgi:2-methylcitrate dehydratase PrpD
VTVRTTSGAVLHGRVDEPKGDPGNTLSRDELESKALKLAQFSGGASAEEMRRIIEQVWQIANADRVGYLLAGK